MENDATFVKYVFGPDVGGIRNRFEDENRHPANFLEALKDTYLPMWIRRIWPIKMALEDGIEYNYYGCVGAKYSDGAIIPVMCGCGGSMYVCGKCYDRMREESNEK